MMQVQPGSDEKIVLLKIQNQKKPEQVITLLRDPGTDSFHTEGLKRLFGAEEIVIDTKDLAEAVMEYAKVLSFLLETLSEAEDLGLPYGYQETFEFQGRKYSLERHGEVRLLRRLPSEEEKLLSSR